MRTRLYSTSRPDFKPIIFTETELTHPTLPVLQLLLNAIAPSGLTLWGFLVAATLWIIAGCDAVQISGLGYLLSALSESADKQPVPPHWLFPLDNFTLTSFQTAVLSSIVYAGMLVGGLFSSPLEKYNGSRPALLLCCISALLAYIGSAGAPNFVTLTICQAIVGLSLGVRIAIVYSNMAQLFPSQQVPFVITAASFVWVLGSMYASTMGWLTLGSIWMQSWRVYMLILTIPSLISLLLGIFFVYETLHFGVYTQYRPTPALDLLKVHYGKALSRSCKHFWYNLLCCCGAGCCGKRMGPNKHTRSLANRYGAVGDQYFEINDVGGDTHSTADSAYSYDHNHNHNHNTPTIDPNAYKSDEYLVESSTNTGVSSYSEYSTSSNRLDSHIMSKYQSNPIDPHDPHNDPYSQQYDRKRKPSMFVDNGTPALAGTPVQGKTFDHEQYLTDELKQQLMYNTSGRNGDVLQNSSNVQFTSANTVYQDTGSRGNSMADSSYIPLGDEDFLNSIPHGNYLQNNQVAILDDHYITTTYIPSSRNKTDEFISTHLDQRDMSGLGLKLINLHSSKDYDGVADWNIDIDNPASVEELFDFIQKQLVYYTATLKFDKQSAQNFSQNIGYIGPDPAHSQQPSEANPTTNSFTNYQRNTYHDDAQNSTLLMSLQSDLTEVKDSNLSQSMSSTGTEQFRNETTPTKSFSILTQTQQLVLLFILCAVWFIVSFQAAGFSSFLPLLWDRVFTSQSDDMKYIVSLIFSAVQLPAGLINMVIISRFFPPRLLLVASLISLIAMTFVTGFFKSQLVLATIFVFVCQFGLSTSWCAINYVALQYFPDDKKILYFALQASVGKFGAFVAQYVFAYLLEENSLLLMIVVTILSAIASLFCLWFNYTVRNAVASH